MGRRQVDVIGATRGSCVRAGTRVGRGFGQEAGMQVGGGHKGRESVLPPYRISLALNQPAGRVDWKVGSVAALSGRGMSQKKAAVGAGHLPARATPVRPASCGRTAGGKAKGQRGGGPEARSNCASANPTDAHHSPAHLGEKDGAAHRDRGDGITGIRRCTVANEVVLTKAARGKDTVPTKAARGKEVNAGDKRTDATMVAAGVKGKNANNTADGNDSGARVAAAGKETDHAKGKHANKDASGRKTKAAAAAGDGEVGRERDLNQVLRAVIEDLRIRSVERSQASRRVNVVVEHLVRQIKQDPIFDSIDTLTSGSYYERVKVKSV